MFVVDLPKTQRKINMCKAVRAVREGHVTQHAATKLYGVHGMTLYTFLRTKAPETSVHAQPPKAYARLLSTDDELQLVAHCRQQAEAGTPLSRLEIRAEALVNICSMCVVYMGSLCMSAPNAINPLHLSINTLPCCMCTL